MNLQNEDIIAYWNEIFTLEDYNLRLRNILDNYPDEKSLFVNYHDIELRNPDFAAYLLDNPDRCINLGGSALQATLPATWEPDRKINLRIEQLPKDAKIDVRNIRAKHLGKLVAIEGMVRKATTPKPRMVVAVYRCAKCDAQISVPQKGMIQTEPTMCPNEGCNKTAPHFVLDERLSTYIDTQKIEIQENPEGLRGGAQPERMSCYVDDDISGFVTPGNRITLNGIIRSVQKTERDKSTIFEIFMDVMSFNFEQMDFSELDITEEDEQEITRMSRDPELFEKIVKSIAPTIYGLENEKKAVALQLFGGSHKVMDDGTSIRGDIHILMIGDPGVAKSQLLRYMSYLSPRGIYASGKSASAAGLCVHGDTLLEIGEGEFERIEDFVLARMTDPEEYRPGIWRQKVSGDKIEAPSELGSLRLLPITYVWKIKAPSRLIKVTTVNGDMLTLTPETKLQAMHDGRFDWFESEKLQAGDFVPITRENIRMTQLKDVETITEGVSEFVYDLTVEPAHAFIGSGFTIHNTAAAVKDDFGDGRWTLEAGALVLADKGLACIDELDKMTDQDRSSLHEAMESQRISVAKAGITATLQCRCSLLAAANPSKGRFIKELKIAEQINLPPALMSRFDLMFVLTDKTNVKRDRDIAEHILKAHNRGQVKMQKEGAVIDGVDTQRIIDDTDKLKPPYEIPILRKYVAYAKKNYVPVMTKEANDMILEDYLRIRLNGGDDEDSISITARQLEAYVRLSEASARLHLRNTVTKEDAQTAIDLVNYYMSKIARTSGGGFDIDMAGGSFTHRERKDGTTIRELIADASVTGGITEDELISIALGKGMSESMVRKTLEVLNESGEIIHKNYKLMIP